MATRSDFAQKLLNDLRQRKERMSPSQSSSRNSSRSGGDGYGNPSQSYKGSRKTKTLESVGSRTSSSHRRSSSGARSLHVDDSSKQLVPMGGSRNSQKTGDLSMALAFALEHRGKPGKLDKTGNNHMLSFLHHISGRSMRTQKMERGSSFNINQFQNVSPIHINEISKGAQKLNQILKAFSNGHNFDGYSVEIGRELLKGALDLQESLRMLANFQESSEYKVTPQRKNRLVLLEEDEDGDEDQTVNIAEQKQVDLPRFSFDKPSRNSNKQSLVPHKRSASFGLDFRELAVFSEPKQCTSSSQSKVEKRRISNVIAKLMGLEEIPQKADSKSTTTKEPGPKQVKNIADSNNMNSKTNTRGSEKKLVQTDKITSDKGFDRAGMLNSVSGSRKVILTTEKGKPENGHSYKDTRNEKNVQGKGRREEHTVQTGKETKQPVHKDDMQKQHTRESSNELQGKIGVKESTTEERMPSVDRRNIYDDHGMQRQQVLVNMKSQAEKKMMEKKEKERVKRRFPMRKQSGSEVRQNSPSNDTILKKQQQYVNQVLASKRSSRDLTNERPLKGKLNGKKQEDVVRDVISSNLKVQTRNQMVVKSNPDARGNLPQATEVKPVQIPAARRKIDHEKVHASETLKRTVTERNIGTNNILTNPLKHQTLILQEMKHSPPEETQDLTIKDSESRDCPSINGLESITSPTKADQPPPLHTFAEDEFQSPMHASILIEENYEHCQDIAVELPTVNTVGQNQSPGFGEVQGLESHKSISSSHKGADEVSPRICYLQQHDSKESSNPRVQELLSERETHLKQILIKSPIFISTAEALFKLNIPITIFNGTDHDIQDEESKLTRDCAYEIMKRKGKRQEVILHPCHKVLVISVEEVSLDELVKHLNQDIEKLKYFGGSNEHDVSDYLQTMLERDVQNLEPDLNSMWDLSWNEKIFGIPEKEELIRDLERVLLNGLIDEVLKDLFHLAILV